MMLVEFKAVETGKMVSYHPDAVILIADRGDGTTGIATVLGGDHVDHTYSYVKQAINSQLVKGR